MHMEERHPIENLMITAMNSIKEMIDVNTIIGDPIKTVNDTVIIPISKVGFGFAADVVSLMVKQLILIIEKIKRKTSNTDCHLEEEVEQV